MALVRPGHWYDKTVIGGNAAVVQGNVHIATAYFACGNQSRAPRYRGRCISRRRRKVRFVHGAHRCERGLMGRMLDAVPEEEGIHVKANGDPKTGQAAAIDNEEHSARRPDAPIPKHKWFVLGLEGIRNYNSYHDSQSGFLPTISRMFSIVLYTLSKLMPGGNATGREKIPRSINWNPDESMFDHALMQAQDNHTLQQLLAYGAAMLSCLVFRNVQSRDIYNVLLKFRNDRTLPIWTLPLGFLLARAISVNQMTRSLSNLSNECIIFEDAFGRQRPISMSICQHFSILKEFLEVHYVDTTGLPLILAGQYNMLLGSRRGPVICSDEWSTGKVKPGSYVVMAVYLRTDCTICISCGSDLDVTVNGEFHCQLCNRYFRDCDTLRYVTQVTFQSFPTAGAYPTKPVETPQLVTAIQTPQESKEYTTNDFGYEVDGLKNVDLKITPLKTDSKSTAAYNEPWYQSNTDGNGLYYCLFETQGCGHRPTKQWHIYAKNLDMHLKPYACKFGPIRKGCRNLRFASEAHLAEHALLVHNDAAYDDDGNVARFCDIHQTYHNCYDLKLSTALY